MEWPSRSKWEQKMKDILKSLEDGHPRFRHLKWKDVFDEQQDTSPIQVLKDMVTHHMPTFSLPLGEESVFWNVWLSDEAIWSRFSTLSQISNLDEKRKEVIKSEVLAELRNKETERNEKGEAKVYGRTYMAWTSRV